MKFTRLFLVVLITLILVNVCFAATRKPELPMPGDVYAKFTSAEDVETYLKKNTSNQDCFFGALYYFYEVVNVRHGKELVKADQKKYIDKGIKLTDSLVGKEKNNALYKSVLGALYGLKAGHTGFPAIIVIANKCRNLLNEAVKVDPDSSELKLMRLRSLVEFPYHNYKDLKKVIDDDSKIVLDWVNEYLQAKEGNHELDIYFQDVKNETLYLLGKYYRDQIKDNEKAQSYFFNIDKDSYFYNLK